MQLPLALINRWPDQAYVDRYETKAAALRASADDAYNNLKQLIILQDSMIEEADSKPLRAHNKRITTAIRSREKWLDDLCKYSDPVAITMASWSEARFVERADWYDIRDTVKDPVLVRGIVSGKIMDDAIKLGLDCYFIETGYLGNYPCVKNPGGRKLYHRIVRNEMQHSRIMIVPDDRWQALVRHDSRLKYQGWKTPGSKILLVSPSEKPCQYYGIDQDRWIAQTTKRLAKLTDREIVTRLKVRRGDRNQNTIYEAFEDDIWCVVTYNSIAAAEAIAYGIPAIALAPTAAAPVCSHELGDIESPRREDPDLIYQWLSSLAYGQFHVEEMVNGHAWRTVLENNERETVST